MVKYVTANVAGLKIGHGQPIAVQSMCNTDTADIEASLAQCRAIAAAGSQLIRLTTQGMKEVEALRQIRSTLRAEGIMTPIVADVHFRSDVAIAAASGAADKVRINPGNFSKNFDEAIARFRELIGICKANGTALRIGLNHGSLGERITSKYGDNAQGMVEALMEWLEVCCEEEFFNVVVSLKSSNTIVMIEAYLLLVKAMEERLGIIFPIHLGVTEAGNGVAGRVKSAVGIGTLLSEGIGDTIRVSLTEDPVNEIPVAQMLVRYASEGIAQQQPPFSVDAATAEEFFVMGAYLAAPHVLATKDEGFEIGGSVAGEKVSVGMAEELRDELLQACRIRFTKPEYIACPSCGRTLYDIESVLAAVKEATARFTGVKIAVMGCIVNGPGEMADADYGYVGAGVGRITLYKGKTPILKNIPQQDAVQELVALIEKDIKD